MRAVKGSMARLSGEGGEIETFVLDGPNFSKALVIEEAETRWERHSGTYTINKASLEDKKR